MMGIHIGSTIVMLAQSNKQMINCGIWMVLLCRIYHTNSKLMHWTVSSDSVYSSFSYYESKQSKNQQLTISFELIQSQVNEEVSQLTHLEQK